MGTLKNLVIAVTGTLEHDVAQLKKWIEANDGRYSPNVRRGITHLIAGKDAWKKASDPVQAANKLAAFVVNYEWLEDSLHKRRKLAEKQYTWEHITQRKRREREIKKLGPRMTTKHFVEGCAEVKKTTGSGTSKSRVVVRKPRKSTSVLTADMYVHTPFMSAAEDLKRRREEREAAKAKKAEAAEAAKKIGDATGSCVTSSKPSTAKSSTASTENVSSASSRTLSTTSVSPAPGVQAKKPALKDLYHYYLDTTGFEYKVVLTRCNLRANEITRYQLSLLESHTKPHVYCTFIQYVPPSAGNTVGSGDACIQALLDFDKTFHESASPGMDSDITADGSEKVKPNPLPPHLPLSQQDIHSHPEAERLRSVLQQPTTSSPPHAEQPYKSLIAPMGSPFATAWRTFRHAFRDLTLLSWEERFDISKTLYKARASHFSIEPFVYVRPKPGLPLGLRVQQEGLFQNQTLVPLATENDDSASEDPREETVHRPNDDAYTYNTFNLPGLNLPLGSGIIGQAVARDIKAAQDAAAKAKKKADEAEEARLKKLGVAGKVEMRKKPNYSRPLFNGVNGRPTTDAWGRQTGDEGRGTGLLGGVVVKQSRPFPREREEAW